MMIDMESFLLVFYSTQEQSYNQEGAVILLKQK